jgi:hypothetical protein
MMITSLKLSKTLFDTSSFIYESDDLSYSLLRIDIITAIFENL